MAATVSENKPLTAKVGGLTRKLKKGPMMTAKTGGGMVLRIPAASPAVAAPAASPAVAAAAKSGGVRGKKPDKPDKPDGVRRKKPIVNPDKPDDTRHNYISRAHHKAFNTSKKLGHTPRTKKKFATDASNNARHEWAKMYKRTITDDKSDFD